jgi:hypothetical protein
VGCRKEMRVVLGFVFFLIALYALATAVVPVWRGAAIPRLYPVVLRPPVVLRRGPLSSLAVAWVCGTVGVALWLGEAIQRFDWGWLFAPVVAGFVLLVAGEWIDWVKFRHAQARRLAERREQLLDAVNSRRARPGNTEELRS